MLPDFWLINKSIFPSISIDPLIKGLSFNFPFHSLQKSMITMSLHFKQWSIPRIVICQYLDQKLFIWWDKMQNIFRWNLEKEISFRFWILNILIGGYWVSYCIVGWVENSKVKVTQYVHLKLSLIHKWCAFSWQSMIKNCQNLWCLVCFLSAMGPQ